MPESDESEAFASAFTWKSSKARIPSEADGNAIFKTDTDVRAIHPIYVIPHQAAHAMREWALARPLDVNGLT